jgi:hypothetical protein
MLAYEGTFNDPNGGVLRQEAYLRLRHLFFFRNELGLFKEIGHAKKFEAHVYGSRRSDPCFEFLAHMFHPSAIDSSYDDFGAEDRQLSGVRDEETGKWSVSGSRERIVRIDYHALDTIRLTYEPENHPLLVQLPWIYSTIDLELISRLSRTDTVESSGLEYVPTVMWDESRAQSEGIIGEHTGFPSRIEQLVVTGPHIGLATFPAKTPRRICTEKNHYDMIDLGAVPRSYLPRSKFQIKIHDPQREVTSVPWKPESTVLDEYRLISRKMIGIAGERTLLASILPPGPPHIDSCFSAAFRDRTALLSTTVVAISIVGDYLVRSLGKSNFRDDTLRKLPYPQSFPWEAVVRCLGLVAATEYFSRLWSETLDESSASCGWSRQFPGHDYQWFTHITAPWHESTSPLRTDIGRRQALVEIDVLIARQLGLTMQGLIHIYRTGFSVLRKYESETYYDACGRIVFTPNAGNRGMSDLVLTRRSNGDQAGWDDVRDLRTGVVTKTFMDDTLPGGPIERIIEYHAPFDRCDREEDYAVAWEHFEKRLREGAS